MKMHMQLIFRRKKSKWLHFCKWEQTQVVTNNKKTCFYLKPKTYKCTNKTYKEGCTHIPKNHKENAIIYQKLSRNSHLPVPCDLLHLDDTSNNYFMAV